MRILRISEMPLTCDETVSLWRKGDDNDCLVVMRRLVGQRHSRLK